MDMGQLSCRTLEQKKNDDVNIRKQGKFSLFAPYLFMDHFLLFCYST